MAESSWPDPANSRVVSERQYELLSARHSDDGVYWQPGDPGPVYGDGTGGLVVHVRADQYASVRGFGWASGPEATTLAIAPNGTGVQRVDRVVLRLTRSDWTVRLAVKTGVTSPGDLTRDTGDTGVWEVHVAWVTVPAAASSIGSGQVTAWPTAPGSRIRAQHSTGRNPKPGLGEIAYDADTASWPGWDGTAWRTLLEDTGWVSLSPANPANWSNHTCRAKRLNGVVYAEVNVRREGSTLVTNSSDAAQGSHVLTLPAGMRPPTHPLSFPTTLTAGISGRLRVYPNGQIYLQAPSHDVGVGRFLRHAFDFPV